MENYWIANVMRRLNGQIATPPGMSADSKEVEAMGFVKFHEWPSGHWQITDRGRDFLMDLSEEEPGTIHPHGFMPKHDDPDWCHHCHENRSNPVHMLDQRKPMETSW